MKKLLVLGCSVAMALGAKAAPLTWTGEGAAGSMADAANWGGATPASGDTFTISNGGTVSLALQNDLADDFAIGGLKLTGGTGGIVLSGKKLKLTGGETAWNSKGAITVNCDVELVGDTKFSINDAVTVNGTVSGSGRLIKHGGTGSLTGVGDLLLKVANTYTGGTQIDRGTISIYNDYALGPTNVTVSVTADPGEAPDTHHTALRVYTANLYYPFVSTKATGTGWKANRFQGHVLDIGYDYCKVWNTLTGEGNNLTVRLAKTCTAGNTDASTSGVAIYGDVSVPNGTFIVQGAAVELRNRISAVAIAGAAYWGNATRLFAPKKDVTRLDAQTQSIQFRMANAVDPTCVLRGTRYECNCLFDLYGFDQTVDRLDFVKTAGGTFSDSNFQLKSSNRPARLTMNASADCDFIYKTVDANVSLVWNPLGDYTLTCVSNRAHQMAGALIVSNGTFRVPGKTSFKSVTSVEVADGATLEVGSSVDKSFAANKSVKLGAGATLAVSGAAPFDPNVLKNFDLAADSTLQLPEGSSWAADVLKVGGTTYDYGTFTGLSDVPGKTTLACLDGRDVTIIVTPKAIPEAATDAATWSSAGAADVRLASNWGREVAPDLDNGEFLATFAESGREAAFADTTQFFGVRFLSKASGFTFVKSAPAGRLVLGKGGLETEANDAKAVYTNAVDTAILDNQKWNATNVNTTVVVKRPISNFYPAPVSYPSLTLTGKGRFDFAPDAPSTYTGSVSVRARTVARGEEPFGPSSTTDFYYNSLGYSGVGSKTAGIIDLGTKVNGSASDPVLELRNAKISKQMAMGANASTKQIYSPSGTTNELAGCIKYEWSCYFFVDVGSRLLLSGGVWGRLKGQGGGDFGFTNYGETEIAGRPFTYTETTHCVMLRGGANSHLIVNVASNRFATCLFNWDTTTMGTIDLMKDDALYGGLTALKLNSTGSKLDLHGTTQHMGKLLGLHSAATIHSDAPATLFVAHAGDVKRDGSTQVAQANVAGKFTGRVSLVKTGADTLPMTGASTSSGEVVCKAGQLAFSETGSWKNASAVTVDGATAEIAVAARNTFGKNAVLRIANGGKLTVPSGVKLRFAEYWLNGVKQSDGSYETADGGEIVVGTPGIMLIVR